MQFSATVNGSTLFSERMRILEDGSVSIGTTNPLAKIQINHNSTLANATLSLFKISTVDASRLAFKKSNSTEFQLYGRPRMMQLVS